MTENNAIATVDDEEMSDELANPEYQEPVVSGPSEGEVKDIDAVGDDHPLVEETGDAALETQTESGAGEFLSDFIYEHDSAWVREWLQNEETACVRAAKLLVRISNEYPDDWLTLKMWVDKETGETVIDYDDPQTSLAEWEGDASNVRKIEVARPIDEVLEAARSLGYDPTIVWDVYRDERKIITEDNGIGMTPYEFDKAFNTIFNSGSGVDGETGGMFGVGSESSALVHGNDGGAEVETRSRRPKEDGSEYDGFRAYSYLGGANALPGEVEEGFKGTRFDIPVQEDFDLSNLQDWVEKYAEKLRVPLLYREHDAGNTPVEEEYEATHFTDDYPEAPVVIDQPGEYTVVAGPDVVPSTRYSEPDPEDTFLVSMPIDRNSRYSINTLWDVVIQIHDEQGRIVAGPNRGRYESDVDDLHSDDVVLPEPTGDRDRLQRDSQSKRFFQHIQEVVKAEEIREVGDIAEAMKEADHPADAIRGEKGDWNLFRKMVKYHGKRKVTESRTKFESFVEGHETFPDFEDETREEVYSLFKTVEQCHKGASHSAKKSHRRERNIGKILSHNDPDTVYMAASTGGNFTDYFRVVQNTHDDAEVIVIKGAGRYERYKENFGFKVLNKVPLTHSDEDNPHDYDVPNAVHDRATKTQSKNTGKPDDVKKRSLKFRTDADNSSIDLRLTIEDTKERLERDGKFGGHDKLLLFPRTGDENISDNYRMAKYAAIASVSKTEYEALADHDNVVTYEEFTKWSKSALIATEDGAKTPLELVNDDRMVILAYRGNTYDKEVVKLLADENEQLRNYYSEDLRQQFPWASHLDGFDGGYRGDDVGKVPDVVKRDTLFAVAGPRVLRRAEWAFNQMKIPDVEMMGLDLNRNTYKYQTPCEWHRLNKSSHQYRLMADTPNWDDDSNIYDMMPSNRDSLKAQMLLGFHDRDIDPSEKSPEELRDLIN